MSDFTPGPWRVTDGILLRVHQHGNSATICGVHRIGSKGGVQQGNALANARLIAAAPAMRDALIAALEWIETECRPNAFWISEGHKMQMSTDDCAKGRAIIAQAKAALAKVDGNDG